MVATMGQIIPGRGGSGIRRGPGRPRLRPSGPGNQGHRIVGHHHGKRIQRPLPVPLRSNQMSNVHSKSTTIKITSANANVTAVQSSSASSSSAVSGLFPTVSSNESRPFGFYTQQQTTNRDERTQNQKQY